MNSIDPFGSIEVSDSSLEVEGLRFVTVRSEALGRRADLTLWIPGVAGPLPIVILLHGVYGSHWAWSYKAGVHRTAARLLAADQITPVVIAMPSDGLWKDGSGYVAFDDLDAERWILDEVPRAVEFAVPSASAGEGVCVGGLSMGGFGALRLTGRHPGRYRGVAGLSSITRFEEMELFTSTPLQEYGLADDWAIAPILTRAKGLLPPIKLLCGLEDPLIEGNRLLHRDLTEAGVAHEYEEHPGAHEWSFWAHHIEATLVFFSECLTETRGGEMPFAETAVTDERARR